MKVAVLLFLSALLIYFSLTEHSIYIEWPTFIIFLCYCAFVLWSEPRSKPDSTEE